MGQSNFGNFGIVVVLIAAVIIGMIVFNYSNTIFNFADNTTNSLNLNPSSYFNTNTTTTKSNTMKK